MRELTMSETTFVAGAGDGCPADGNNIAGVTDPSSLANDLIEIYEALVSTTSHIIERVANSL